MEHSQYAALADMSASAQPPPPSSIQASVLPLVGSYSSNSTMDDVINSSGEYVNVPPSGSSYMTIGGAGMMATSMMGNNMSTAQQHSASTLLSCSSTSSSSAGSMQPSNCSTTTFKTPLLPMPTLEDIEVGLQTTQQPQQMMPAGILKYPVCSNASNIMAMPPPMGIGPGPPQTTLPPPSALSPTTTAILYEQQQPMQQQQQQHQQHQTLMTMSSAPPPPLPACSSAATLLDSSTCGTLKSSAKLQTPANLQATATTTTNGTSATANSQIVLNLGVAGGVAVLNNCNPQTSTTMTSSSSSSTVVPLNLQQQQQQQLLSTTTANSSKTSSRSNLHNRPASPKCCACFGGVGGGGGGGRGNNSSSSYNNVRNSTTKSCLSTKSANSSKKGRRRSHHSSQTFWSAVLTNLGICALLLAYTLLGSFIFLTIESDEATFLQQQRTLASTKRNISPNSNKQYPAAATTTTTTNHNNLYQIQQQQQQQLLQQYMSTQHMDNSSMSSSSSSSSSGSYGAHQTASSSSSTLSHLPEGGVISFNNNNNDFGYGDVEYPSQYPDSTYDVRQRTIENIWDITVSLNILYKENWTKLAALEIAKFQDQLIKRLNEDAMLQLTPLDAANSNPALADGTSTSTNGQSPATEAVLLYHHHQHGLMPHHLHYHHHHEWNFAKAFLYSLTVLTTIGYGNIAPRTTLGRMVTLAYAFFGIPLTLVYLSSTGGILAKVARDIFSKALCCCLCSNCGYCCYDEKRMAEKERRMKRKRQQEELRKQQAAMQEPYYVRSGSMADSFHTPEKQSLAGNTIQIPDLDSLSASESRGSMHGLAILAPILLCFSMMIIYILFGAVVLYRLEEWPLLDGIYFCFMSLSTIGFGDMMPGFRHDSNTTIWFCSIYIMSGMALTAMCFNVIHEEIVNRLKIVVEFKKDNPLDTTQDDTGFYMPP